MKNTAKNQTRAVTPRETSASSILRPCRAWAKLGHAIFSIALVIGLSIPFSLHAQSSGPRYGRSTVNGALYLLPNQDLSEGWFGPSSVVSGLRISCAPTNLTAAVGQTVTWFSSVTGGSGTYFYMWSGTESLFGNTSAIQKAYTTRGEKSAILTVTSGTQQITVSCGGVIIGSSSIGGGTSFIQPGFGASCYATPERAALGESVTWLSIVSGTTASTTYSWDGTDGLSGDRPLVSKTYTTNGNKVALLTVTNGSERIVAACTNAAAVGPKITTPKPPVAPPPASNPAVPLMAGLCAPSAAKATTDEKIAWRTVAIGGTGTYRFTWTGDDELFSEGTTTVKQYETAGIKKASVLITSGERAVTIDCAPIAITKTAGNGFVAGAFLSWIDGPVGLILAAIVAIVFGIFIALRKRSKEETAEEEGDHVK